MWVPTYQSKMPNYIGLSFHIRHDLFILPVLEIMSIFFCFYFITLENQSFRPWCELLYLEEHLPA